MKYGKVAVTIHRTTAIHETDDVFFVPQGKSHFSVQNLHLKEYKIKVISIFTFIHALLKIFRLEKKLMSLKISAV